MIQFAKHLFSSDFVPHGVCFLWNPGIVWLHAISDGLKPTEQDVNNDGPGATFHVSLPALS